MSCLSLFLEVFGHLFISLTSGVGYFIYTMKSQYIIIVIILSMSADFGRVHIGMRFGTRPFAKYVAPDMRLEGAILSVLTPLIVSYGLFHAAKTSDFKYFIKMNYTDYMWIGQMTGFLSLMGFMMISFFKRCAMISVLAVGKQKPDDKEMLRKMLMKRSSLMQVWYNTKVLDIFFSIILPMMFAYWYATTYLEHTFNDDPFKVSMYTLILRNLRSNTRV